MIAEITNRRGNRELENSRINRNGLRTGTPAPAFCLPRLDGSELCLHEYGGRKLVLVFSDPSCGPCNRLAPQLEQLHRRMTDLELLMISRGDPAINQLKVAEHGLTFPVVLQRQWEISLEYGMFATPIAYSIDERGIIAREVAVGEQAILALVTGIRKKQTMREQVQTRVEALRNEFEMCQVELERLGRQRTDLREFMLRISGALQVLEELPRESEFSNNASPIQSTWVMESSQQHSTISDIAATSDKKGSGYVSPSPTGS